MICLQLFLQFLKIGAFSFGGGSAMLPMIEQTMEEMHWMDRQQLYDFVGISESTPGPIAVNLSTYIGSRLAGLPGAFSATLGVILPSFLIILCVARVYMKFRENRYVGGVLQTLRPIVVGMLAVATLSVAANVFSLTSVSGLPDIFSKENVMALAALATASLLAWKKKHPILIICVSAAVSIGLGTVL